jgi:hypothetical protein
MTASPDPAGTVTAAAWLTAVRRRWRGGRLPHLAERLAALAGTSPDGAVDLDSTTVRSLLNQVHLVTPGLRRLLDTLVQQGFLTPVAPADGDHLGTYRLTVSTKDGHRIRGSASAPPATSRLPGRPCLARSSAQLRLRRWRCRRFASARQSPRHAVTWITASHGVPGCLVCGV